MDGVPKTGFSRNRYSVRVSFLVIITPEDLDCALRIIRIQHSSYFCVPIAYADGSIDSIFRTVQSHQVFSGRADID